MSVASLGATSAAAESEAAEAAEASHEPRRQQLLLLRQVQQRAARLASGPLPRGIDGTRTTQPNHNPTQPQP